MTGNVFRSKNTLRMMTEIPATNRSTGQGMGIFRAEDSGVTCYGHSGFWGTAFYYCPARQATIVWNRYQSQDPAADYDPSQVLTTALRIDRLATRPAGPQKTRRIARNTQALLLEESHLAHVIDPAGGGYPAGTSAR